MKRILFIVVLIAATWTAVADPVSPRRAATVADHFWHQTLHQSASRTLTDCSKDLNLSGIYLFVSAGGGFVIVSADDVAQPILGYSTSNRIDPDRLPIQLVDLLSAYRQEIDWAVQTAAMTSRAPHPLWTDAAAPKRLGSAVPPMLRTLWDQDAPYNNLCPEGTVTGCAATAQTQLMKYWNFPAFGNGSHSYVHSRFGTLGADFAHTVYDWANMPDSADARHDSEQQQLAVATLMYHVGVSLDMQYNTPQGGGSAAPGLAGYPGYTSMDNSLKDYFFYSQGMHVINKGTGFTDETWRDTLMAELDLGHPILYTGTSAQGGHGFVCDGYDSLGMMHFNFGWSGMGNGYYAIGSITPGIGPNGQFGQYDFSSTNQALLGAVPIYALRLSDTVKAFVREGGSDSMLLCINPSLADSTWSLSCNADWLTVTHDPFSKVGWIHVTATQNNSGVQRVATVTFSQGGEQVMLRVLQDHYGVEDYCPMTVVMESRRGNGWLGGAHLSLESEGGQVFGTAQLAGGSSDTVTIPVSPLPLHVVWHSGGGTDRFVNYSILDPNGTEVLKVENAYLSESYFVLPNPCSTEAIPEAMDAKRLSVKVSPNPATDMVRIESQVPIREWVLTDMTGRRLSCGSSLLVDVSQCPSGIYMLQVLTDQGMVVQKLLKTTL